MPLTKSQSLRQTDRRDVRILISVISVCVARCLDHCCRGSLSYDHSFDAYRLGAKCTVMLVLGYCWINGVGIPRSCMILYFNITRESSMQVEHCLWTLTFSANYMWSSCFMDICYALFCVCLVIFVFIFYLISWLFNYLYGCSYIQSLVSP